MTKNNIASPEPYLKKHIKELEQALDIEKMRTRSFETMTYIAEN